MLRLNYCSHNQTYWFRKITDSQTLNSKFNWVLSSRHNCCQIVQGRALFKFEILPQVIFLWTLALKVEIILDTNRSDQLWQLECMKVVSSILRHIVCSNSYLPSSSAKIGIVFCHLVHALGRIAEIAIDFLGQHSHSQWPC